MIGFVRLLRLVALSLALVFLLTACPKGRGSPTKILYLESNAIPLLGNEELKMKAFMRTDEAWEDVTLRPLIIRAHAKRYRIVNNNDPNVPHEYDVIFIALNNNWFIAQLTGAPPHNKYPMYVLVRQNVNLYFVTLLDCEAMEAHQDAGAFIESTAEGCEFRDGVEQRPLFERIAEGWTAMRNLAASSLLLYPDRLGLA